MAGRKRKQEDRTQTTAAAAAENATSGGSGETGSSSSSSSSDGSVGGVIVMANGSRDGPATLAEPEKMDLAEDDPGGAKQVHNIIRTLAETQDWPDGPGRLEDLFRWQEYNAKTLLGGGPDQDVSKIKARVSRLVRVLALDLDICEAYSGTGNGAVTLHQQFQSMVSECRKQVGFLQQNGFGSLAAQLISTHETFSWVPCHVVVRFHCSEMNSIGRG